MMGQLMGAFILVNEDDPDGTDFNQLRDATIKMRARAVER